MLDERLCMGGTHSGHKKIGQNGNNLGQNISWDRAIMNERQLFISRVSLIQDTPENGPKFDELCA